MHLRPTFLRVRFSDWLHLCIIPYVNWTLSFHPSRRPPPLFPTTQTHVDVIRELCARCSSVCECVCVCRCMRTLPTRYPEIRTVFMLEIISYYIRCDVVIVAVFVVQMPLFSIRPFVHDKIYYLILRKYRIYKDVVVIYTYTSCKLLCMRYVFYNVIITRGGVI